MQGAHAVVVYILQFIIVSAIGWWSIYKAVAGSVHGIALGRDGCIVDLFVTPIFGFCSVEVEFGIINLRCCLPLDQHSAILPTTSTLKKDRVMTVGLSVGEGFGVGCGGVPDGDGFGVGVQVGQGV